MPKIFNTSRAFLLFTALLLAGCALTPNYDSATFEETLRVGKEVDFFYGTLLETPDSSRHYPVYASQYAAIETDLRFLRVRNGARPLNKESTRISEIILDDWIKYKGAHRKKDGYSSGNARLDRDRFNRLFASALDAEAAKKIGSGGQDSGKGG